LKLFVNHWLTVIYERNWVRFAKSSFLMSRESGSCRRTDVLWRASQEDCRSPSRKRHGSKVTFCQSSGQFTKATNAYIGSNELKMQKLEDAEFY
jgi:hypothetical protein